MKTNMKKESAKSGALDYGISSSLMHLQGSQMILASCVCQKRASIK